ncbi:hypothetical protein E1A91_D09G081900v1 [Gossypium mustelinum]|uniref:Uncharacterized protein n=1 Tax=Gossypium mustelinum TaxID=34275 RepID=A0A5D2TI66_GOSMU|nr:hypothetical protein E1A91_D09G081900v1 [Gossypium mustelinum]
MRLFGWLKLENLIFRKVKKIIFFQFGESRTECSNAVVQNYENSNVQRKKSSDCERRVRTSSMVELSMTMEDIVQLIEQESDAELRTQIMDLKLFFWNYRNRASPFS